MNKILVTGGAGFIGLHLCKKLLDGGNKVICLDNFSTSENSQELCNMKLHNNFTFVHHDVQEPFNITCDRIYHLACPASPVHYQKSPVRTIKTAFIGTMHALENAKNNSARLLLASTSEIYGDPQITPQTEDYLGNVNTLGVRGCYNEGKRSSESLAYSWVQYYGTPVRIARIFNTYGPQMDSNDGRLIPKFICKALQGNDLTIYGDGNQTRSFCYIDDTVKGLQLLMETNLSTKINPFSNGASLPVVNIGNPDEHSVADVATRIINATNSKSKITYLSRSSDDPKQRCPDISRAVNLLKWKPAITLDIGLSKTIEWFRNT